MKIFVEREVPDGIYCFQRENDNIISDCNFIIGTWDRKVFDVDRGSGYCKIFNVVIKVARGDKVLKCDKCLKSNVRIKKVEK